MDWLKNRFACVCVAALILPSTVGFFWGACSLRQSGRAPTHPSELRGITTLDGCPLDPRDEIPGTLVAVVFISHDCPISNALAPELCALAPNARGRGVCFYAVHANPPEDLALVVTHGKEFGFSAAMTVLLDPDQTLARATGARVMPEAVLFRCHADREIEILYSGRVNDLYSALGRRRASPTRNELRDAIDAAVAGVAPVQSKTKAIGCFIEMSPSPD